MSREETIQKLESGNYQLIPTWERYLRYVSLIGFISLIFYIGTWTNTVEKGIGNHADNTDLHRTLPEAQSEFVTRREFEILSSTLKDINTNLKEINNKLK